jgi:hypothetical protein
MTMMRANPILFSIMSCGKCWRGGLIGAVIPYIVGNSNLRFPAKRFCWSTAAPDVSLLRDTFLQTTVARSALNR